jgi:hypothetical protein
MSMRQTEYQNNTPEQVREYLQAAANIVAELDIAPDLVTAAFVQAVQLVAAKQIVLEQVGLGMAMPRGDGH